ncbi:hypothetical protein D3C73_1215470 [compost metagenome]
MDLFALMSKCVQITGTLLTPRSDAYKAWLTQDFMDHAFGYFERGEIQPVIDSTFSLERIADAHRYMEQNRNTGKIIIKMQE